MTKNTLAISVITIALTLSPTLASAKILGISVGAEATVSASTTVGGAHANASANASARLNARLTQAKSRADEEIARRIKNLTGVQTRINGMKHISASDQTTLSANIQTQITAMSTLQTQIDADTATSSLKADIQSITKSYRIYMLVIPQAAIMAAADRVLNIASEMQTLSATLSARISAAAGAGVNVTAMNTSLTDYNAKIADAQVQANAAVSEVASLKPDNGDQTIAASNTAALKDARTKIQAAQQDLLAARKDAGAIVKALKGTSGSASVTSTSSASVTP